jgi:hypothetical protein
MSNEIAAKIKKTQDSFAPQAPGAVVACPFKKNEAEALAPVEVKTDFQLTQQILKTMGASRPVEKAKEKKAWIEIILVDMKGNPIPNVRYRITPPGGGAPQEGRLNQYGQAGYYNIEAGECKITFPDLDKDAWE